MSFSRNRWMILYHGGQIADHAIFWPLSHFGSKQAALDRINRNFEDTLPNEIVSRTLYRCQVDLGPNIIDLPDWHAAVPSGVILAFWKAGLLPISQSELIKLMEPINRIQRSKPLEARRMVLDAIQHLRISAVRYPNQHEGERGGYSYCLVDSTGVRVLDYYEIEQRLI